MIRLLLILFSLVLSVSSANATQQTIPGGFVLGDSLRSWAGTPTTSNPTIDAAGEKVGFVFQAPKTGDINSVGFLTSTVTTGCDVDVRIETVSLTNGDPTGTLADTDSNATQTIQDSDDDTWFTVTLTDVAAVTKGDIIAAVIVNPGSSFCDADIKTQFLDPGQARFPYGEVFTSSWTKNSNTGIFFIGYSGGAAPIHSLFPMSTNPSTESITFNSGDVFDEVALRFKTPFPCTVSGAWIALEADNNFDLVLYEGTTAKLTISVDKDLRVNTNGGLYLLEFPSTFTTTANTEYFLSAKPGAGDIVVYMYNVNSTTEMASVKGGVEFQKATRVDGGSWSVQTTQRPFYGIFCSQFDDATGGGGGTNASGAISVGF